MIRSLLFTLCWALVSPVAADVTADERAVISDWLRAAAKVRTVQSDFDQVRRLTNVTRPLIRPGKIWMEKPDSFRWQIGEPPTMVASRGKDGRLIVLDAREKKARIWSREALLHSDQQGIAMMASGFGESMAEFEKNFAINSVEPVTGQEGVWRLNLSLRDRQAVVFVKGIVLTVCVTDGSLRSFVIQMRDGSQMETLIRSYRLNAPIKPELFRIDTTGYTVEEMKGGR